MKIKKWKEYNKIEEKIDPNSIDSELLASFDKTKYEYFLVVLLNGDFDDLMELDTQLNSFHQFNAEVAKNEPPFILYYNAELLKNRLEISALDFRNKVQEEANNLGLKIKVMSHFLSQYDFELDDDVPRKLKIDVIKGVKSLNK